MKLFLRLWKILEPFHRTFGWFVALLVVYEALQVAEGYVMSATVRLFNADAKALVWVIFIVGLAVYDELFMRLDNNLDWYILKRQVYPIFKYLRVKTISKFLGLDMNWHQRNNSGVLVGKVIAGVEKVHNILDYLTWEFVPTTIQMLLSLVPLLIFSPQATLVALSVLAVFIIVAVKGLKKRKPLRKKRHDFYEDEWRSGCEIVRNIETAVIFGQKGRILKEYEDIHDRIIETGLTEARLGIYTYNRWQLRILSLARRSILAIWAWQLYHGTLDIAGLIFVNVLIEKLFHSFWRITRLIERVAEASEGARRLADLMEEQSSIPNHLRDYQLISPVGIKIIDAKFSYPKRGVSVNGLSFEIKPGQVAALVGKTGAGKTTVRRLVTRQFDLDEGEIYFGGVEIKNWGVDDLAKYYSCVPQGDDVGILDDTIRNNIAYPKPDASQEEVEKVAKLAGIHDFIVDELPEGYNTEVGERGQRLSGGQKQRVALARAILDDKPVLFLDEATNSVDAITEEWIQKELRQIFKGKTVVMIAHRLSTIWDIADNIVVLDQGRKVEEGTHDELIAQNGLYAEMVKLQIHNGGMKTC